MKLRSVTMAAVLLLSAPALSIAADFEVKLLNKGADGAMVFEPAGLKIAPGDTSLHPHRQGPQCRNHQGHDPGWCCGVQGQDERDDQGYLRGSGVYGVKCAPHVGMGMVAAILVGDAPAANLDAFNAAKLPKKARERIDVLSPQRSKPEDCCRMENAAREALGGIFFD